MTTCLRTLSGSTVHGNRCVCFEEELEQRERVYVELAIRRAVINKLAQILALTDTDPDMSCRASGDCVCEFCREPYYRHATHPNARPWLTMLCDGRNVHL